MATTTLATILGRLRAVCEAAPLSLTPTTDQFSHESQPNTVLDNAYRVVAGDTAQNDPVGGYQYARIDEATIFVMRTLKFDPETQTDAIEGVLNTLERRVLADGVTNNYHATLASHEVTRPEGQDVAVGSLTFLLDYDFDATVS